MKNFSKTLIAVALSAVSAGAVLAQGATPPEEQPFFPDVPRGHWAFSAVQKLAAAGIIEGRPASASRRAMTPQESEQMAALLTPKIKTALMANAALKGALINVDTSRLSQTITLSGTVRNMEQAQLASQIALSEAPGSPIVNRLQLVQVAANRTRKLSPMEQRRVIAVLQTRLAQLKLRRNALLKSFTVRSPEVKEMDQAIAFVRAQLQKAMRQQSPHATKFQLLNG